MLSESQKLSTYYVAFWTGFVFGHPLCEGSASVTTDDPVLVACVTEIERFSLLRHTKGITRLALGAYTPTTNIETLVGLALMHHVALLV